MAEPVTEVEEVTTVEKAEPQKVIRTTKKVVPPLTDEHPKKVFQKKKAIFRTYQFIWYIVGVLEVLLGFRVTLKALGANPFAGFTNLIYTASDPFALPFRGILPASISGASVIEWSTIVAAIVYFLIAWGVVAMLQFAKPVSPQEVEETVETI